MTDVTSHQGRGIVLQPQEDAPPGLLADWARRRDVALEVAPTRDGALPAPDPQRHDFAVVLGSEDSLSHDTPAWVADVLSWLRAADAVCLPVLGICFGAQALAAALGGSVHRLETPEIGWVRVTTADADRIPAGPWMAWHEDGLQPPPLAYELARNEAGTQAFCLRRHLAVQFHPEVTADIVDGWARFPGSRLPETGQTPEGIVAETTALAPEAAARAEQLFDGFAARAGLPAHVRT